MKTDELLNLNYYKENNSKIFQKALRKIKPFSKFEEGKEVPLLMLERLIGAYERKYEIKINYVFPLYIPGEQNMYKAIIIRTDNLKEIGKVYSCSLYELFVKLSIKFFSEIKNSDIPER